MYLALSVPELGAPWGSTPEVWVTVVSQLCTSSLYHWEWKSINHVLQTLSALSQKVCQKEARIWSREKPFVYCQLPAVWGSHEDGSRVGSYVSSPGSDHLVNGPTLVEKISSVDPETNRATSGGRSGRWLSWAQEYSQLLICGHHPCTLLLFKYPSSVFAFLALLGPLKPTPFIKCALFEMSRVVSECSV